MVGLGGYGYTFDRGAGVGWAWLDGTYFDYSNFASREHFVDNFLAPLYILSYAK